MSLLRDMQTVLQLMTAGLQSLGFVHKEVGSQNHAVANDIHLSTLKNTRWNRAQHVFLSLELQRVASIRTTLETSNNIILGSQNIDYLTFSFIAPLQSEQDIYFTLIHLCVSI